MNILLIETATAVCSVALAGDEGILAELHTAQPNAHSSQLSPLIGRLYAMCGIAARQLGAVCVSSGPGSYTGLRIGVSTAKGICYALGIPLLSVPTLQSMASQFYAQNPAYKGMVCPMIDARRMEVYAGVYDRALRPVREVSADVVDADTYRPWLDGHNVYFFGNGAKKCMETINHPNAHYIDGIEPLAKWMQPIAERRLMQGQTEDVAYYVPFYLKDFVAKMPKKLL